MSKLSGKAAVVTGASKGIGAGIAKGLAAEGAAVVVNYASSKEGAEKVVAEINAKGGKAIAVQGDVAKAADVKRIFATRSGFFDGSTFSSTTLASTRFPLSERLRKSNFIANSTPMCWASYWRRRRRRALSATRRQRHQYQLRGERAHPAEFGVYTATKGAVNSVTRVLAKELGPRKIRVNSINPGVVETEGTRAAGVIGGDLEKQSVAQTPLGRTGQPDDIAPVAVFLASDKSRSVTGDTLAVSGGTG